MTGQHHELSPRRRDIYEHLGRIGRQIPGEADVRHLMWVIRHRPHDWRLVPPECWEYVKAIDALHETAPIEAGETPAARRQAVKDAKSELAKATGALIQRIGHDRMLEQPVLMQEVRDPAHQDAVQMTWVGREAVGIVFGAAAGQTPPPDCA